MIFFFYRHHPTGTELSPPTNRLSPSMSKFDRRGSDSFIGQLSTTPLPECGRVYSADGQVLGGARQKFTLPEESQYGQYKGKLVSLQKKLNKIMIASAGVGGNILKLMFLLNIFKVFIMGQSSVLLI